jgi:hypothetical protein
LRFFRFFCICLVETMGWKETFLLFLIRWKKRFEPFFEFLPWSDDTPRES